MRYSKMSAMVVFAFTISLPLLAVPVFAADSSAHTLTIDNVQPGYSCATPTIVSGTATGKLAFIRDVKLTITNSNNPGVVYASSTAEVKHGTYSGSLSIASSSLQEGWLTVTASWYGVVVSSSTTWFWAC
jgi:hypothetical protein